MGEDNNLYNLIQLNVLILCYLKLFKIIFGAYLSLKTASITIIKKVHTAAVRRKAILENLGIFWYISPKFMVQLDSLFCFKMAEHLAKNLN